MAAQLNISNIMSLTGQVALVTGGGTGIGFAIAKGFAANGAKVYITGRREETLRAAAASLPANEGVLIPLSMDVTDQASIDRAAKYIQTTHGRLDILVNNAGVSDPLPSTYPDFGKRKFENFSTGKDALEHETFKGWTDVFDINTSAPFFMVRAFSDLLVKGAEARNSTASVINIGSVAASVRSWLAYGASKTALEKVSVGLATDFARRKIPIRVNVIHPGVFPSAMVPADSLQKMETPLPGFIAPTPLGRAGTEAEMVMTAMYLAACTYATGASIAVDGGLGLVNP
ncbi:NAD(P)-binding protein [Mucidula mucida]|nr:NAD(P)-binding protein [Mucidula mucida]